MEIKFSDRHRQYVSIKGEIDRTISSVIEDSSFLVYGIHYPVPLHLQKAYASLGYRKGDFPVTERLAEEILSLPMYPELSDSQIRQVVEAIRK